MRQANVYISGLLVGRLTEDESGYIFTYNAKYLNVRTAAPVSLTMPLRARPYYSTTLFSFFDGLIPEGWLLDIVAKTCRVEPKDRMGLLLACCKNCVGAVSITPANTEQNG